MTSTPVKLSKVRMLRPSRPMIRPFMVSSGRWTVELVDSATYSPAILCMAWDKISLASLSERSLTSCSASRMRLAISLVKSSSVWAKIMSFASDCVRLPTRSSSACFCFSISSSCSSRASRFFALSEILCSFCSSVFSLFVKLSSLRSRLAALSVKRLSICLSSWRSDLNSASTSSRYFLASSLASNSASFLRDLLSLLASFSNKSASRSACPRKLVASCSAFKSINSAASCDDFILTEMLTYPMTKPMMTAKTTIAMVMISMFLPH